MDEPKSILIVDDDDSTCRSLTLIFREKGYEIETANTGYEAMKKVQASFFNLALLDIKLPDMEGIELIAPLKGMHPDLAVIMITAHASLENAMRALNEGASAYITKPLNIDEALTAVREVLEKQRLVIENRELYETVKRKLAERNQALEALRASEANLRNLIVKNADGMVVVEKWGTVHFANPAAEALFEGHPEEFLGKTLRFPIAAGEVTEVEIVATTGQTTTAEMSAVEIEWEGKRVYLASLRDITERRRAAEELDQSFQRLRRIFEETVRALTSAVEMKDPFTAGHQRRVAKLSSAMAEELDLPRDQIDGIRMAGLVHDIGKLAIPTEILSKPVNLTLIEREVMKTHPTVGHDILKTVEFPWPVAQTVLQHHERLDGSGYPQGLSDQDILLEAKILGVADVVEAMSYPRPWGPRLGIDKALEEISDNRGILYDREVVDACLRLFTTEWFSAFKFEDESDVMAEKKREFADRHRRRLEFWEGLLKKAKERTTLLARLSPDGSSWIGTSAGRPGLQYNCVIAADWGAVELYIDRGKGEDEANHKILAALHVNRETIERGFGGSLNWDRLDGKRGCRIERRFTEAGLKNRDKWSGLQDEMIDALIKLERSLGKHIAQLPI